MIKKVTESISKHGLLDSGDTVVVAVSGGPDSVALLRLLADIAAGFRLRLVAAHFNHALRGEESDRDAGFVAELAASWGLPFETERADIRAAESLNACPEDAARISRYAFLAEVARRHGAARIALGHHLQDQSETIIMNLLRGTGVEGLRGMVPIREGMFIRPLLGVTRGEILDFLKRRGLGFRTDSSNLSNAFQRNRIRNQLIPELKRDYNPRLDEQLGRLGEIVRLEDDFMNSLAMEKLAEWGVAPDGGEMQVGIEKLAVLHEALQRRIVKAILESLSPQRNGIGYNHVLSVINLCRYGSPHGRLALPFGIKAGRTYGTLRISAGGDAAAAGPYSRLLALPGEAAVPEAGITVKARFIEGSQVDYSSPKTACLDYDRIVHPLEVRNFRHGDRMQPLGLKGSQKIKKIFIDRKIDTAKRMIIPMIADGMSVLWIPGIRFSERAKVSETTKRVIEIEIV